MLAGSTFGAAAQVGSNCSRKLSLEFVLVVKSIQGRCRLRRKFGTVFRLSGLFDNVFYHIWRAAHVRERFSATT
jgi:hypothetical protein